MAHIEFRAQIQQTADDPMIPVRVIVPELLNQVRVRPEFTWYGFRTLAAYETPPPRSAMLGHNTLVEFSLPYTLHLPSEIPFEVTRPQAQGGATVVLRKVWTDLATGSNEAEVYADNQLLYYGPAELQTPTVLQAPELGPWPRFTGTNIEVAKDTQRHQRFFKHPNLGHGHASRVPISRSRKIRAACFDTAESVCSLIPQSLALAARTATRPYRHPDQLPLMRQPKWHKISLTICWTSIAM